MKTRSGLKKIKKSTRKGLRSYWVRQDPNKILRYGTALLGSAVGAKAGPTLGSYSGKFIAKSGAKFATGNNERANRLGKIGSVSGYFAGGAVGGATGLIAGNRIGHRISKMNLSNRQKMAIGTFAAIAGTGLHVHNAKSLAYAARYVRSYLRGAQ